MELIYERKIADEMRRCKLLREEINTTQKSSEVSLANQKDRYEEQIQNIKNTSQKEMKSFQSQITQLQQELTESDKVFREILDQQEEEYEMELSKLQATSSNRLNEEVVKVNEAKGNLQALHSRKKQLLKQNEELRHQNSCSDEAVLRETELRHKLEVSWITWKFRHKRFISYHLFIDIDPETSLFFTNGKDEIISMRTAVTEYRNNLETKSQEMQKLVSENRSLVSQQSLLETEIEEMRQEKIPMSSKIAILSKEITALSYELKKEHEAMKKKDIEKEHYDARLKSEMKRLRLAEGEIRAWKREFSNLCSLEDVDEIKAQILTICKKRSVS